VFLGLIALVGLGGTVYLVDHGTDPAALVTVSSVTSAALASLGTLLASSRSVDVDKEREAARDEALADVASLAE
jgi:hypothetical protein